MGIPTDAWDIFAAETALNDCWRHSSLDMVINGLNDSVYKLVNDNGVNSESRIINVLSKIL